jgi:RND family efflux transporter MFP subunit
MKKSLIFAFALVGSGIFSSGAVMADDADSGAHVSALVHVAPLSRGSLPITISAFGQVKPAATAKEIVTAPIDAKVESVAVQMGQVITKNTPMVTVAPSPDAAASYTQAQIAVAHAHTVLERDKSLAKAHLATQTAVAGAEKDLADAQSAVDVLVKKGAQGPLTFKAPFDAIVLKVDAGPGSVVTLGGPLIELARPDGLMIELGVDPARALSVKAGDPVSLSPLNAGKQKLSGKVLLRSAVVNSDTGLVSVQVSFPAGTLLIGENVHATITVGQHSGYLVPHAAVLIDGGGGAYVVQAIGMVAKKVNVQVTGSDGDTDVIDGKLDPKAPIILEGNYQLDNGTKLRIAETKGPDAKGKAKQ